jgi:hypothetical protein
MARGGLGWGRANPRIKSKDFQQICCTALIGLYDSQGVLRFTGRDRADCLAYAELFGLGQDAYSLISLAWMAVDSAELQLAGAEVS